MMKLIDQLKRRAIATLAGLLARVPWLLPVQLPRADWQTIADHFNGKDVSPERLSEIAQRIQAITTNIDGIR